MIIKNTVFGDVDLEISICPRSSVNAFIEAGWKEDEKNDEMVALTSDELDTLQNEYGDLVSQYAWRAENPAIIINIGVRS